jgi:hypothetical protein
MKTKYMIEIELDQPRPGARPCRSVCQALESHESKKYQIRGALRREQVQDRSGKRLDCYREFF